jgi:ER-bound oxygenase mpaB/B'/Rubber oxygenase, catalytic domain
MTPSRYLNEKDAAARFGGLAQTYAASLMRADAAADALIEALHHTRHHAPWWSLVLTALSDGVASVPDAPAELRAFVAALPAEPTAEEWDIIEQGGGAIARTGDSAGLALQCAALMIDYWSSPFSKPLELTGNLMQHTAHRLAQTGAWWIEAHEPGGLRRDRDGFKTTLHVRLIHASVRRRMATSSGVWDTAAWGLPINQGDLFFQVVGFTWLVLRSLERMGYSISDPEKAAYYRFWRYVAALMGVDDELLPLVNEADCARFWELWLMTNPGPDADTAGLAHASLEALAAMGGGGALTRRVQLPILCGTTRWLLGERSVTGSKSGVPSGRMSCH